MMKRVYLTMMLLALTCIIGMSQPACAQDKAASPQKAAQRNLAIVIFDHVQIIDYTGPYETFGHVWNGDAPAFNIYTVSEKTNPITTAMGMSVIPKYSFENAPTPDIIVVPGGGVDDQLQNANTLKWLQEKSKSAEIVMSVCNGAFILAKAGLLDGLEATTTAGLIPLFREAATKTRVVDDRRFVDNGKFITAAGLSSGIDGALHVIERLYGKGTAQMAALGMEYNWDPESKYARAALADRYMQFNYDVKVADGGWKPLSREGNRDEWENRWSVTTDTSANEILNSVNTAISTGKTYGKTAVKWTRVDAAAATNATQSQWRFTDEKGSVWNGTVRVEPEAGARNKYLLSVRISRGDATASAK